MKYQASVGCTVFAYARVEVEASSEMELKAKLCDLLDEQCGEAVFEVEWESCQDFRVVRVENESGHALRDQVIEFLG